MKHPFLRVAVLCILLSSSLSLFGQTEDKPILVTVETLERESYQPAATPQKKTIPKIKDFYRHHKQLPSNFEGFVIELTTSDFPLKRDYHLFSQFGTVYYTQVKGVGYSYCIIADFSSKKSVEQYLNNIVIHKAPEAKFIEYKKGKRMN